LPIDFSTHPTLLKYLRYGGAYGLLFAYFFAGIWIIESLRTNVLDITTLLKASPQLVYFLYSWGSYFLYAPFLLIMVVLEAYMNTAAKTGQVLRRARKVILVEGAIGLVSVLITLVLTLLNLRTLL
jgi:hypothetical protein